MFITRTLFSGRISNKSETTICLATILCPFICYTVVIAYACHWKSYLLLTMLIDKHVWWYNTFYRNSQNLNRTESLLFYNTADDDTSIYRDAQPEVSHVQWGLCANGRVCMCCTCNNFRSNSVQITLCIPNISIY